MDQLAKDAIAAQKAGMSYGKYMATKRQPAPEVQKKKKTIKKKADAKSEEGVKADGADQKLCQMCGEPIPAGVKNRKYCSHECAGRAREQQASESKRRKRQEKKAAAANEEPVSEE